jgi:4-hydroxy-tetrahydrodipicolinate synthase
VVIETETLVRLAEHPRIIANKDAKGDLEASQWAMARSDLAWYSGEDSLNLALLALGAGGMVSVVGHVVGDRLADMAQLFWSGDVEGARVINESLLPVYTGIFRTQGVILTKAALQLQGLPSGPVRPPLVNATLGEIEQLRQDLVAGGVALPA